MDALKDFAAKDMIEQISLLDELRQAGNREAVPALMELYANPLGDQAVDEMVYHTLFDLLAGEYELIKQGMAHPSNSVRLLCVRRAAEEVAPELKPALVDLLAETHSIELAGEIIRALSGYRDSTLADTLAPFLNHEDYTVVAWAIRALTSMGGEANRDLLVSLIEKSEDVREGATGCDLRVAMAIEALAGFPDQQTIDYLVGYIHHPNPSLRKVVIMTLGLMGEPVLPALEKVLARGNKDERIMAANILGNMGIKKSADILVAQRESAEDPNLRFAIYEALGRISSIRSVIGLVDGLAEENELVLLAVVTGIDNLANPGVAKAVGDVLSRGGEQAERLLKAMVTARATRLFSVLFQDGAHSDLLVEAVNSSGDPEAVEVFRSALLEIGSPLAKEAAAKLNGAVAAAGAKRLLAADDSKAMLFFYKGVAADLGMELVTVEDGRKALELLKKDAAFDVVITDMNMPNMDGIELTRELRNLPMFARTPILMATTESEQDQVERARSAGVTDFITKPFTKEQFKEKLASLFGG